MKPDRKARAKAYGEAHGFKAKGSCIYRGDKYICTGWGQFYSTYRKPIEAWEAKNA